MKVRHLKRRTLPTYARYGSTPWLIKYYWRDGRKPMSKRKRRYLRYRSYWK